MELPHLAPDADVSVLLEDGAAVPFEGRTAGGGLVVPAGYHRIRVELPGKESPECTLVSAPRTAWRRPGNHTSWGLAGQLSALRSRRSRSTADVVDLESTCRWVHRHGGDLMAVLPLLPTFNRPPSEPSPYSPVSRLFWSELLLDLGRAHRPVASPRSLDVEQAAREVRRALSDAPLPDGDDAPGGELRRYARFRGAQARLGRDWRRWPAEPRSGRLADEVVDPAEERFHLVAQREARRQLLALSDRLAQHDFRIGLDLAVGVHPDGYDPWARPGLFARGISVGAPPDRAFPSGQDWGFPPLRPEASREEGHAYHAAAVAHQAEVAGLLRVDHVMALSRLFWIPHGLAVSEGTYVRYPMEELLAVLSLESHRNRCEIVGENLGTVPAEIDEALPRHGISGTYLAPFAAATPTPEPPKGQEVAMTGTHDTATLQGWLDGRDIDERVRYGLVDPDGAAVERERRAGAVDRLKVAVGHEETGGGAFVDDLLEWLGRSPSPLVIPWIEDLWLEEDQVNVPGTRSSERPNWQRPMRKLLEEVEEDADVQRRLEILAQARCEATGSRAPSGAS